MLLRYIRCFHFPSATTLPLELRVAGLARAEGVLGGFALPVRVGCECESVLVRAAVQPWPRCVSSWKDRQMLRLPGVRPIPSCVFQASRSGPASPHLPQWPGAGILRSIWSSSSPNETEGAFHSLMRVRSEKCVLRQHHRCANCTDCTCGAGHHAPRLCAGPALSTGAGAAGSALGATGMFKTCDS